MCDRMSILIVRAAAAWRRLYDSGWTERAEALWTRWSAWRDANEARYAGRTIAA